MRIKDIQALVFFGISSLLLLIVSFFNYPLFHLLIELVSIFVGLLIFIIAININEYSKNRMLLPLGIAYIYIGVLDFMHGLTFDGFHFVISSINISYQYWIFARLLESVSILTIMLYTISKKNVLQGLSHFSHLIFVTFVIILVQYNLLPLFYDNISGVTIFKVYLDLIIIILFILGIWVSFKINLKPATRKMLILILVFKILSQVLLITSPQNVHLPSLIGHLLKYLSFGGMYIIFVSETVVDPFGSVYKLFQTTQEELIHRSERDSLTGLYNHAYTFKKIEKMMDEAVASDSSLIIVLMDIDDFKIINDKHGHLIGDEILVKFSEILLSCSVPKKIVGRYGGDEFVMAVPDVSLENLAANFKNLGKKTNEIFAELGVSLTFSAGVAFYQVGDTVKDVIYKADIKMYESKRKGKNQFSIWDLK